MKNIFGEIHLYEDKNSVVLCKTWAKIHKNFVPINE